jgi:replication initiation protein RepC
LQPHPGEETMPTTDLAPAAGTGFRRVTPTMFEHMKHADSFAGLPAGAVTQWSLLAAFQEAEPYLGLPADAHKLLTFLVKFTFPQDWQPDSRPIAWPDARRIQEALGISPAKAKRLTRALFEAGIFIMRDHPQGKRFGRRDKKTGRIIEAYGFDLSPLALRYDEFVQIAADAAVERSRKKEARTRMTIARRTIIQIGEQLAELDALPASWPQTLADIADLGAQARRAELSTTLAFIVEAIERRQRDAEQILAAAVAEHVENGPASSDNASVEPVIPNPKGLTDEPPITTTNLTFNLKKDAVIASEESSRAATSRPTPTIGATERGLNLKPTQLLALAPRLADCVLSRQPQWRDIVDAAGSYLCRDLGVSTSLWDEACIVMGRERAAVALAITSTKPQDHFTRGAGAYFAGMMRKDSRGELHLERTLWGLRSGKKVQTVN